MYDLLFSVSITMIFYYVYHMDQVSEINVFYLIFIFTVLSW